MAKKNSTKTATKEALQASEPRLQQFSQWKGIDFSLAPHSWSDAPYDATDPSEWPEGDHRNQSDLPVNTFMVQNNINICSNGSVETRNEAAAIGHIDKLYDMDVLPEKEDMFTGINHMVGGELYVATYNGEIQHMALGDFLNIEHRENIDEATSGYYDIQEVTHSSAPGMKPIVIADKVGFITDVLIPDTDPEKYTPENAFISITLTFTDELPEED